MAIRTYDILLDSYNSTMPEPIVGRQGDKNGAVTLHVTITDRGTAVDLTGQTVNLMAETAKDTAVVADNAGVTLTDAVNGKFDYAIPNALWSEAGKIKKAYFSLNNTDGQQTTYDLIFIVKKAIDISQEKADDYITVIDDTIRDLKTKSDDYIAVIDGTVRDLQSKVDAIYADFSAGNFYNKAESDSRFATTLQVDNKLANYYTKSDSDNKFYLKTDAQTRSTYVDNQLTQIRTIANTNVTTDTGWQEEGLNYINGFKRDIHTPISYRILQFGANLRKVILGGWLIGPALAKNTEVDCLKLPDIASLSRARVIQGRYMVNLDAGNQHIMILINGNNLRIKNLYSNNDMGSIGGWFELEAWI